MNVITKLAIFIFAVLYMAILPFSVSAEYALPYNYYTGTSEQDEINRLLEVVASLQAQINAILLARGTGQVLGANYGYQSGLELTRLSQYSGPAGGIVEITGMNLLDGSGNTKVWILSTQGIRSLLTIEPGATNTYLRVRLALTSCQNYGSYPYNSYLSTNSYFSYNYQNCLGGNYLPAGEYEMYVERSGVRSNSVTFNITGSVLGASYPNNSTNYYPTTYYSTNYYPVNNYTNNNNTGYLGEVTLPRGGEVINIGDNFTTQWTSSGFSNIEIWLKSRDEGSCKLTEVGTGSTFYTAKILGSSCYSLVTQKKPGPFYIELRARDLYTYSGSNYANSTARSRDFYITDPSDSSGGQNTSFFTGQYYSSIGFLRYTLLFDRSIYLPEILEDGRLIRISEWITGQNYGTPSVINWIIIRTGDVFESSSDARSILASAGYCTSSSCTETASKLTRGGTTRNASFIDGANYYHVSNEESGFNLIFVTKANNTRTLNLFENFDIVRSFY